MILKNNEKKIDCWPVFIQDPKKFTGGSVRNVKLYFISWHRWYFYM